MEVPTDRPIEFELGDTAADIQRGRGYRERGEEEAQNNRGRRVRGRKPGRRKLHTQQRREWPEACKDSEE